MPVLSLLGMLAAVVGILFLAHWATKLLAVRELPGTRNLEELCVVRQIPVGRGERIVLLRLHERFLLLGTAQGSVTVLAELTAEEAEPWRKTPETTVDFRQLLRMAAKKK